MIGCNITFYMFEPVPSARADLKAGTLYAVGGEDGWIYYGQVTPEKNIGFFNRRDREIASAEDVLASHIMSVIPVGFSSITKALRSGRWKRLGRYSVVEALDMPRPSVQWPVGTTIVTVWLSGSPVRDTRVEDPSIQDMERIAAWDAEAHIPGRLTADFGAEKAAWFVGGPIRRERRIKEEMAIRFPDAPWHALPADWVPTNES